MSNESGLVSVPMVLLLFAGLLLMFGLLSIIHRWQTQFARQISLDRCVGRVTQEIRDSLRATESSNHRMEKIRAGIVAATLLPKLRPPLMIALKAEAAGQKLRFVQWQVNATRWRLIGNCRLKHVRRSAYPDWPWIEQKPDSIGERPYIWNDAYPRRAQMRVDWKGFNSGAELNGNETDIWRSRWKQVQQPAPSGWADND